MADNVEITAGSGTVIATDDISGVHYQIVKIGLGAANAVDMHLDSGQQTMANSVPVTLASNQSDVNVSLDSETVTLAANSGVDIGDVTINNASGSPVPVYQDITGVGDGVKTVTTAGTDEALAGSTSCKRVIIQAQTDNTDAVAVGASGVDATEATGTGILLYPGDSIEIEIDNLADIYVDALQDGEGVRYIYFT